MKSSATLTPLVAMLFASALLVACDRPESKTAGERLDAAIAKTEQAGADVKASAQQAAADAERALADTGITARVQAALAADGKLSMTQISVSTQDGQVTLTGSAPDAQSLQRATVLAQAIDGVKDVRNQLIVNPQG